MLQSGLAKSLPWRRRRERNRKKSTPSVVETADENVQNVVIENPVNLENGNLDDGVGEENHNDSIMTDTFEQEEELENAEPANASHESGSDVNNTSEMQQGFATSSLREGITRRTSVRQAAKRARLERLPSLMEESESRQSSLPRPISPISPILSDSESTTDPSVAGSSSLPPPPAQTKKFVPRRKPLSKETAGRSNFRSPLNVNVGKGLANEETLVSMSIPSDLVEKFETFSQTNTKRGMETGGILAGKHLGHSFQVTHLIIPEQIAASDRWEVQDERQITNYFVYQPEMIMLGLIHTHPKMTSFLSSVDLHALWDYAQDNQSLISIVLAPERKTSPAYCLTKLGLSEIGKCKETGFHKHKRSDEYLYKEADHVIEDQTITTLVADFRIQK